MKMDRILNKRVKKLKVKDLKKALKDADDEQEICLSFMLYDKGRVSVYLAEIYTRMGYDPVVKDKLFDNKIVELLGYTDDYSTYIEEDKK